MKWTGHVSFMEEEIIVFPVLLGEPEKKEEGFEYQGVVASIILKFILM
jgi:hypothetical protein